MRVLVSTTAGAGHFGPLVPFANACRSAGHEVIVAAPASFADSVAAAGLEHAPFNDVPPDVMGEVFGRLPFVSTEEANAIVLGEVFARLDAQAALPGLTATIEAWQPDIVLHEPNEFASWVAAEKAGIPQVHVAAGLAATGEFGLPFVIEPLAELRALAGLPEDPELDSLRDLPCFTMVPPTFDGQDAGPPGAFWRFREAVDGERTGTLPSTWGDAEAPLVYVSFGSVTSTVPPFAPIYPAAIEALADAPARVLMTTGEAGDPAAFASLPDNVHVERWWPQADVMPLAAAVIGHGGFGTTMLALAAGVPQVVIPLFAADQFINGNRIDEIGAGICIDGGIEGVKSLPTALRRVLDEPSYRDAATLIADEIAGLPDTSDAVPILERLASA